MASEPILISSGDKPFHVFTNPSFSKLSEIPLIRFTADNRNKLVYVWNYYDGFHAHVSVGMKFSENFDSLDFLKGHAEKKDNGTYEMVGSDFLNSFVGKMTGKEKVFLNNLLNQDWGWVDDYIEVTRWIDLFRNRYGL
jgi:hypothetical protein